MEKFFKKTREDLHRIPEIALEEFKTASYIRNFLRETEIEFLEIGTSTLALFHGESDVWIGLRADIDALPMSEETNAEYSSEHAGMMHACGHDGHVANLMYFAKWLKTEISKGAKLKKSVMLIFQAGEEGKAGAKIIADSPHFYNKKFQAIFALHLDPALDEGKIACKDGALTFQNINLDIVIKGKGCHGAQPFKGVDSILVGSKLVESYQSIVSRNIEPDEPLIITIGSFKAGTVRNIIPEKVEILGTIRLINRDLIPFIQKRIEAINKGLETAYDVQIDMKFQPYYPPIINSSHLFTLLQSVVPEDKFHINGKLGGSEDFSFYLQNGNPGLMFLLGTKNKDKNYIYPLHNSKFDFDPKALQLGFETFKNLLIELKIFN